ncbi:MAG: hypothetical protein IJ797_02520 [Selenomonadaceae bacterium]|nr:hypothetical protein [Selenomonadaceae bacterium]
MNGRENSTALALFFTLVTIGALIKGDELVGIGVGSFCAIMAAFFVKQSIMQAAVSEEENHQRLEIQFQQLRQKINDGGGSNQSTIDALNENTAIIQESLQSIQNKLSSLDTLSYIAEVNEELKTSLNTISENLQSSQELTKKIVGNSEAQAKLTKVTIDKMSDFAEKFTSIEEKINNLDESNKKSNELAESSQTTVQTGLKLLQAIGQMLKAPPFAKDIAQLGKSIDALSEKLDKLNDLDKLDKLDKLEALETINQTIENVSNDLSELTKINDNITESAQSITDSINQLGEMGGNMSTEVAKTNESMSNVATEVDKASANLTAVINAMRSDITKLATKIDAYNGLMKTALEQYSTLTSQDVKILEKIAEKVQ